LLHRFDARHVASGVRWIWDGGVMSWRATDLAEDDGRQQAADLTVTFNQYGQRDQADRREVSPPIEVESATWSAVGDLDYLVKRASGVVGPGTASRPTSRVDQSC
jgi:hypothetical protein